MLIPWYFPPVVFLAVLFAVLVFSLIIYKIADCYLSGAFLGQQREESDYDRKRRLKRKQRRDSTSVALIDFESSLDYDGKTIEIELSYMASNSYLSGMIKKVTGLQSPDNGGPSKIRFQVLFLSPKKSQKLKTAYTDASKLKFAVPWGFVGVTKSDIISSSLRFRLYTKGEKVGFFTHREVCLGEMHLHLQDLPLNEKRIVIAGKLLDIAPPFPSKVMESF